MTKKSVQLISELSTLMGTTEQLRETLGRYKRASAGLIRRIEGGDSVFEAFDDMDGAMRSPRELTEMLTAFEQTRHQVRLALFELAAAQGATMSEVGRRLGVSRQLAARLGNEAANEGA
jgi:hypothetical protein